MNPARNFLQLWLLFAFLESSLAWGSPKPCSSTRLGRACGPSLTRPTSVQVGAGKGSNEFWEAQQQIMKEMADNVGTDAATIQGEGSFAQRRNAVLGDTLLVTVLISSLLWLFWANPWVTFSYIIGSTFGLAYSYGLSKYVESLGGSIENTEAIRGAGVGQARFAFLIILVILVGKFRSIGILEIPSILGFFSYQLATLSQGLREYTD